jgi:hypothetical protein
MNKEQIREAVRNAIIEIQAVGPRMSAMTFGMLAGAAADRAADKIAMLQSTRVGAAPFCHQDPAHDSQWCAVHDEVPSWHDEVPGWRGPAGAVCVSGGLVLDERTGTAAQRAHSVASEQLLEVSDELDRYPGAGAG